MSELLQTSVVIQDVCTELVIQPYADRILVLVTQMGKVGNLIQATVPSATDLRGHPPFDASDLRGRLPPPPPAIQLTPIFGSAPSAHMQTLYSLYAAQIATLLWVAMGGEPRGVIVGIALHRPRQHTNREFDEEEQQTFYEVMHTLQTMLLPMSK